MSQFMVTIDVPFTSGEYTSSDVTTNPSYFNNNITIKQYHYDPVGNDEKYIYNAIVTPNVSQYNYIQYIDTPIGGTNSEVIVDVPGSPGSTLCGGPTMQANNLFDYSVKFSNRNRNFYYILFFMELYL